MYPALAELKSRAPNVLLFTLAGDLSDDGLDLNLLECTAPGMIRASSHSSVRSAHRRTKDPDSITRLHFDTLPKVSECIEVDPPSEQSKVGGSQNQRPGLQGQEGLSTERT